MQEGQGSMKYPSIYQLKSRKSKIRKKKRKNRNRQLSNCSKLKVLTSMKKRNKRKYRRL